MTDIKQLNSQIAALEAGIADKAAELKAAQASWDDWRAGNLRAAIGREQAELQNLKAQRASLAPMPPKRSSAVFYGSNS
jgi:multidrug resistance efflux pump